MRELYCFFLYAEAVIAFYYASRVLIHQNWKKKTYIYVAMLGTASGTWSAGYGFMYITDSVSRYMVYRAIGIAGLIFYAMFAQQIIAYLAHKMKEARPFLIAETVAGLFVYFHIVQPKAVTVFETPYGYGTAFSSNYYALLYTIYIVVVALILILNSGLMAYADKSKLNRRVAVALLRAETFMIVGMFIDTILPAFGINYYIPATTILQFFGFVIFYQAMYSYNQNTINKENMTEYVYSYLKTPVMVFDKKHKLIIANNSAYDEFEIPRDAKLKQIDFWHEYLKKDPIERIDSDVSEWEFNHILEKPSENVGEAPEIVNFRIDIDPIYNSFGDYNGYVMMVQDITDSVRNIEIQKAAEMKTAFLANMSHEIRTPLNAILGFNDAIMQNPNDKGKVSRYATSIHEAGENLRDIINSILDISKIEMGQLEIASREYNTVTLIDNVVSMFEMLARKKGLDFIANIDSGLPERLIGDEPHLRQILTNIMGNAVKYTDEGSITFTVKVVEEDKQKLTTKILFSVKDTGRGIKEEDRERLFEKFSRLDTEHFKHTEGTGLGMSIVLYTLKAMGSKIELESEYLKGSDFYFVLEQTVLNQDSIGDFETRRKEMAVKNIQNINFRAPKVKVLIVDDVQMNIDAACALLEFTQMKIDHALSGREAIAAVRKTKYDVIFMDHMMPEMDGIQATEKIRNLSVDLGDPYYASVPIIALTANALVGMSEVYHQAGMQAFVSKPIELSAMLTALKNWLPPSLIENAAVVPDDSEAGIYSEGEGYEEEPVTDEWSVVSIPGIVIEEVKKYNANLKGYENNLRSYERSYESNCKEIEDYYLADDLKNYVIKVHGLKSTSKMIGAMELSEAARQIEAEGNEGVKDEAKFKALMEMYAECVKDIRNYFDPNGAVEESKDGISEEEYLALITRIKTAADSFDSIEFMTLGEELYNVKAPANHLEEFEKIREKVASLSFGDVSEMLR